jgi:hypothetical protein
MSSLEDPVQKEGSIIEELINTFVIITKRRIEIPILINTSVIINRDIDIITKRRIDYRDTDIFF